MKSQLEIAIQIAEKAHKGQKDRGGNDYIEHCRTVASSVESIEEKIVAYLHDVIEDTDVTEGVLLSEGISDYLVEAVVALTKKEGQSEDDYYESVAKNSLAVKVKLADLSHNMDLSRLKVVKDKDILRQENTKNVTIN